jgi:hypothetical protein
MAYARGGVGALDVSNSDAVAGQLAPSASMKQSANHFAIMLNMIIRILSSKRILYWGWLRMALGVVQMSCALSAAFAIFAVGLQPVTWALVIGAFAATALSRLLYRGQPDPNLKHLPGLHSTNPRGRS